MEGELGVFVGLSTKSYSYLIDDGSKNREVKDTKKCVIKGKLKSENWKNCLEPVHRTFLSRKKTDIDDIKKIIIH